MKIKFLLSIMALSASTQAIAWGDLLGNVLQGAAQQAVGNAAQQAVNGGVQQPAAPAYQQPGLAQSGAYLANGCWQNVPAGPPNFAPADIDNNGCVKNSEYYNHMHRLQTHAPQYLGNKGQATAPAYGAAPQYPAQAYPAQQYPAQQYPAQAYPVQQAPLPQYGQQGYAQQPQVDPAAAAAAAVATQQAVQNGGGNAQAVGTAVQGLMGLFGR